ncbi:hypothetical protein D3C81_2011940 [compost metagenome]
MINKGPQNSNDHKRQYAGKEKDCTVQIAFLQLRLGQDRGVHQRDQQREYRHDQHQQPGIFQRSQERVIMEHIYIILQADKFRLIAEAGP